MQSCLLWESRWQSDAWALGSLLLTLEGVCGIAETKEVSGSKIVRLTHFIRDDSLRPFAPKEKWSITEASISWKNFVGWNTSYLKSPNRFFGLVLLFSNIENLSAFQIDTTARQFRFAADDSKSASAWVERLQSTIIWDANILIFCRAYLFTSAV